ncbi:hypothetical protein K2X85_15180 [bacterium]|nr:hypothetical protein [bacterium]
MSTATSHTSPLVAPVVDVEKARYVAGTLSLLIDVVQDDRVLATILRQARNELVSLIPSPKQITAKKKIVRQAA